MGETMKHTLTLHSVDLKVDIDEKKEFLDQVFGRGKKGPENEYSISSFDILGRALTTLGDTLEQEDYGKVYDFLQAVEGAVSEGFSKVADDLFTTSRNTMREVDTVKLFRDEELRKDLDCDVPSMYNIIIALLEGMKIFCHERMWGDIPIPKKIASVPPDTADQICETLSADAELKGEVESETSDEIKSVPKGNAHRKKKETNKETKKKATKKEPKKKEVVSSGVKKVITHGGKKTK